MSKRDISIIIVILLLAVGYFVINRPEQGVGETGQASISQIVQSQFIGEKGEKKDLVNGEINLAVEIFSDNLAHYYNTDIPNGTTIYFFVIKDKDGVYRTAANACQVCFDARMGFRQEGDFMVCNTCGNKYPLEKIATEKGGCNPGPINPALEVKDGQVIIKQSEIEEVAEFF